MFFDNAIIDEMAYSAMDAGEYDGTRRTWIPALMHCSKGILSNPAEQQSINLFPLVLRISICSEAIFLLTKMQMVFIQNI